MQLVDHVRAEILAMPNPDSSIREQDLVEKFRVSRTSVREALKQLEVEKLIERRRNKGTTLRRFSLKEIADTYDIRAALEGFAGNLVVQKITAEQLTRLERLADEYKANEDAQVDPAVRAALDDRFHAMIVDIADNSHLRDIMHNFSILKQAFSVYLKKNGCRRPLKSTPFPHHKIVEAIRRGDGEQAEHLLRRHCLWAKHQLMEQFTGMQLEEV